MRTLRPEQARAAALLGRGLSCRATARELSVSERSLTRWRKLPVFQAAERAARADHLAERPNGIRAVLEQALHACRDNGTPDYATRLRAAGLLLGAPPEDPGEGQPVVVRKTIYIDRATGEEVAA
jgi:hypothetical protein